MLVTYLFKKKKKKKGNPYWRLSHITYDGCSQKILNTAFARYVNINYKKIKINQNFIDKKGLFLNLHKPERPGLSLRGRAFHRETGPLTDVQASHREANRKDILQNNYLPLSQRLGFSRVVRCGFN